jgi:tRNA G10  N-methylase Trm11
MKYFFILGNHPDISIAEIYSVFGDDFEYDWVRQSVLLVETEKEIQASDLIKRLGGTIKIGEILKKTEANDKSSLLELIREVQLPKGKGKFKFGFSYYGKKNLAFKAIAMEYKNYLKEKNISCRWVTSREAVLSSVVVEQNKLTDKNGYEFVFIETDDSLVFGRTLSVQPFKDLSMRDFGRPARDDRSGMLPPKLAQIMLNLSGVKPAKDLVLLDPFCGSGTVLMEAALMGYKNLIGSDISKKAVEDTRQNLNWILRKFPDIKVNNQTFECDVTNISSAIDNNSLSLIITEPFLGPQRGEIDLNKIIPQLEKLYSKTLVEFKKILKPKGRVVMIWPLIHSKGDKRLVKPIIDGFKIIKVIPSSLLVSKFLKFGKKQRLVYGRPGQKVWRQIVVLEKK